MIELHIITLCALLVAIKPATEIIRAVRNWSQRRQTHRQWLRDQNG